MPTVPLSLYSVCRSIIIIISVRNDTRMQGIKVLDTECKISKYADDTTFILDGSQSSFSRSLYLLDTFALISGLKVDYEKTDTLWIGSCKRSEITLPSSKQIFWPKIKYMHWEYGYQLWKILLRKSAFRKR